MSHRPAPPAVAKRGLVKVSDNLQPDQYISVGRNFMLFFRDELESRMFQPGAKRHAEPDRPAQP